MKSMKPSVDILEGLSIGLNKDFFAPYLIHKWFTGHSRLCSCCVKFMLFFFAPHALTCRKNLWRDLKILVTLRTAVL